MTITKISAAAKRRWVYIWILLVLCILLVAASYTWFSITRRPRVSDMEMYINSPTGLELAGSYDSTEWVQQLDFVDLVDEVSDLKPVTWSTLSQCFYAASYGVDGRMNNTWNKLSDEANANRQNGNGYYTMCTFYARSDEPMRVSLSPAMAVNNDTNGSGTYVIGTADWDAERVIHEDGGTGAQYAIRMGFRITPVDPLTGNASGNSEFYIYEPNSDRHVLQPGEDVPKTGYIQTGSIDGAASLIDEAHIIRQTTTEWTEASPVQRTVVIYIMGEFETPTELFSLQHNGMVRIDLYVWLEGQDIDCTNVLGNKAKIFASVQFKGDPGHSGMEEIPG